MCGRSVVLRSRVQLDRAIRELAQEVVWVTGIRPKDAVRIATVLTAEVEQLYAFDGPLIAKSGQLGDTPHRAVDDRPRRV